VCEDLFRSKLMCDPPKVGSAEWSVSRCFNSEKVRLFYGGFRRREKGIETIWDLFGGWLRGEDQGWPEKTKTEEGEEKNDRAGEERGTATGINRGCAEVGGDGRGIVNGGSWKRVEGIGGRRR
ncbi:hypothetical protein HAX54_050843, partial [Datura stramonium]|nr:hypothetical protein [Datura stramonium]